MAHLTDPSKLKEFKLLEHEGKYLASIGDLKASLQKFELAKQIFTTSKLLQRIEKLKAHLNITNDSEEGQSCHLSSGSSFTEINTINSVGLKSIDECTVDLQMTNKVDPKILSDIQNIQNNQRPAELKSESSGLSPASRLKFKELKIEAKELSYIGKWKEAINSFKRALSIRDSESIKRYIEELELRAAESDEEKEFEKQSAPAGKKQLMSDSVSDFPDSNYVPRQSSDEKRLTNTIKDQFEERKQFSDYVEDSAEQKVSPIQSNDGKILTNDVKDQFQERKHSSVSLEQKSSASDSKDDFDIEKKLAEVKLFYEEARDLASKGKLKEALKLLYDAQSIHETQKVQKRIDKIKELIAADISDTDENKMVEITKGFEIYYEIYKKLYPYQREGVAWMWTLYKMGKGGILGDDMGLGKTFQVIAFISGMIDADLVKHILIIMPVSLLKNWEKEFKKWCPGIAVYDFHSGTKKERERNKLRVQRKGHVLLTTYGMIVNNVTLLTEMDDYEFVWDYVILDEGHKIKNPTKTTKAVYDIPAKNRIVLSGTPIQNNLKELWSLFDFVHQGTLLGSLKTFKMQYENPITRSREKDATAGEKRLGTEMAENLKTVIKPYFLRRTKDEVWGNNNEDIKSLEDQMGNLKITQLTTKKNDLILWSYMSDTQIAIYQDFLHTDAVKSILVSKRSPLVELTTLKKICDHPRLLSQRACFHLGLNGDLQHEDEINLDDESTLASSIDNVTDECLLKESGKLKLVIDLLEHLKETGHRTLVFSLSRKILDMIHRILVNKNWKVMRLDGTITKTIDREKRIMKFQRDPSYPVFLLTTQVGGVGITLTAADRVIIYDPSWNPATDAQAVDRAYRIGQQKNVVVYRLITCGTVEEKIYRRQIFKDSITRQTTGAADPFRYFSKQELRELFSLDDPRHSATQVQLHEMHASQRSTYDELEKHLEFVRRLDIFGISDHDLMFSKQIEDPDEDNDPNAISEQIIKKRVEDAHKKMKEEAQVVADGIRQAGTYRREYSEAIPLPKKTLIKDAYKPPVLPEIVDLTEDAYQNDVVPPNNTKKRSYASNNNFEDDIQIVSPKSKNGSLLDEEEHLSPTEEISEDIISKPNKLSFSASSSKNFSQYPEIGNTSYSENAVDYSSGKFEKNLEVNSFNNTEKLRESSFDKLSSHDKVEDKGLLDIPNDDDLNLDETRTAAINKQYFDADDDHIAPDEKPLDVTCSLKEKFQANLTHYMNDVTDFSFDEQTPTIRVKKGRKSCARQSTTLVSESDSSNLNSASNSNMSLNSVDESESGPDDSSNSASLSFVAESAYSTPQTSKVSQSHDNIQFSVSDTPPSAPLESQLLSGKKSPISDFTNLKLEGSVGRITPLKVDKSLVQENSSFVRAMANSLIITPESSSKNEDVTTKTYENLSDSEHENDSPIKIARKKAARKIHSDSDESDTESYSRNVDQSNITDKHSYRKYSNSSSDEENENDLSESYDSENEDEVEIISNSSDEEQKHSLNDSHEDNYSENEEDQNKDDPPNDSNIERVSSEIEIENEYSDQSELEQTFATCKDKAESDSDDDLSANNSDVDLSANNSDDDISANNSEDDYDEGNKSDSLFSDEL